MGKACNYIQSSLQDKVLEIAFDRDEQRNALNSEMCETVTALLKDAGEQAKSNDSIRVVVFRGRGRAFCAGADLGKAGESAGGVYGGNFHEALWGMLDACVHAPIPVVADIQGPAVGAGTQLALACDLRIVGPRAWFGVPATQLGFALDAWTIHRAQTLLGGHARNLLLAGTRIPAEAALHSGFAYRLAEAEEASQAVQELAHLAPLTLQHLKMVLNHHDRDYGFIPAEQALYDRCWSSEDAAEAKQARAERRSPVFRRR